MPNARVGAMPQPNNYQNNYPPGRGTWRNRRQQGGLSIEDLKRQTAIRLAQEGGENSDAAVRSEYDPSYQGHHQFQQPQGRHNQPSHYPSARPQYNMAPNANQYSQPQHYAQHHTTTYEGKRRIVHYASSQQQHVSRNYTDSQLGLGGRGGGGAAAGQPQQYSSVRSPVHQQYQQQYATPRVPDHELALKDRGSAENSDASEGGYIMSKGSSGSNHSSHHRPEDRNAKQFKARGLQSPNGRRTPVRDGNVPGQQIFFSPHRHKDHQRDHVSTPTSVNSEPRRNRSNPNSPHNLQQRGGRRSQNHLGYHRCRNEPPGGDYNLRHSGTQPQSKLPHGLTVQELKEMTRARLAADADAAEVSSLHSGGTHGSSNNGSIHANVIPSQSSETLTRNLVQTNDSIRQTQSYGANPVQHQYQQHQQQHRQFQQYQNNVRHPSPVFGATVPNQFNGAMQSPRRISPLSDYQGSDVGMIVASNSGSGGTNVTFSPPPMNWSGGEGNRSRCHSAEATLSPLRSAGSSMHVPMSMDANRRRCLTTSPLATRTRMDRVSEDKPFWFSDDDKDRLAIPQLSVRPSLNPAPTAFSDSAFQPIGKGTSGGLHFSNQRPEQLSHTDRMMSEASQGHGDLPSSMAEAVLNSLTGAPPGASAIGGDVIGSPFRSLKNQSDTMGDSPFRFRTLSDNLLSGSASGSELGTHSWAGEGGDDGSNNLSLSNDFHNLLNIGDTPSLAPLRGRANTEPPHMNRWN
mmetsp:Transcript_10213/g.16865  ORF Transcript_10213/g.16865 Transcript_10213/m.16865 type:complete len:741 (-) Transcript_10213:355-2577(-)